MQRLLIVALLGILVSASGEMVHAVDIPILNSGFEDPELDSGTWVTNGTDWEFGIYYSDDRTDWILGDDGSGNDGGVWHPDTDIGFSDGAYAGENTGWAFSQFDIDAGLSQVLEDTLQANTEYHLQVQVGNPFYNQTDETAEYRIELLAGDVLLASDTGESPEADVWELHSVTYSSGPDPDQLGEPLGIRLIAVEFDVCVDGGCEVDFDEVSLTAQGPAHDGDYNEDGLVDVKDIDFQSVAMKNPNPGRIKKFDENGDGVINFDDRLIWVKEHRKTWVGDANMDNEFNSGDLVAAFAAGKYDQDEMAGWAEGDWSGDMRFGSGDLVVAFSDGGYELGPRPAAAAVPEPSCIGLITLGVAGLAIARRRRLIESPRSGAKTS